MKNHYLSVITKTFAAAGVAGALLLSGCTMSEPKTAETQAEAAGGEVAAVSYECDSNNMFGLEKIEGNGEYLSLTFNSKKADPVYFSFDSINEEKWSVDLSNLSEYKTEECTVDKKGKKYTITIKYSFEEENLIDPEEPVIIEGADCYKRNDMDVEFDEDYITLTCSVSGGEVIDDYTQTYDFSTKKWSEIEFDEVFFPLTNHE